MKDPNKKLRIQTKGGGTKAKIRIQTKIKDPNKKWRSITKDGGTKQKIQGSKQKIKDQNKKRRSQTKDGGGQTKNEGSKQNIKDPKKNRMGQTKVEAPIKIEGANFKVEGPIGVCWVFFNKKYYLEMHFVYGMGPGATYPTPSPYERN